MINLVIYVLCFYFCGVIYVCLCNVKVYWFFRIFGLKKFWMDVLGCLFEFNVYGYMYICKEN